MGAPGEKLIQKMLDTNYCYILDSPEGEGFAWVGKVGFLFFFLFFVFLFFLFCFVLFFDFT